MQYLPREAPRRSRVDGQAEALIGAREDFLPRKRELLEEHAELAPLAVDLCEDVQFVEA